MFPLPKSLGNSHFGASTFFASAHPSESCGSNGLPLTPNSIRIYGCAQALYVINNPYLCSYIDIIRGKHERIMIVQEYYRLNLKSACEKYEVLRSEESLLKFAHEILQGLVYLNNFGTVCRNLSPETILIDSKAHAKLYGYGLYFMTEAGSTISFPIGNPKYLPPELLIKDFLNEGQPGLTSGRGHPAWDSWSLGIILLERILNVEFFANEDVGHVLEKILTLSITEEDVMTSLIEDHNCERKLKEVSSDLVDFIQLCLRVDLERRPVPSELLCHPVFKSITVPPSSSRIVLPHFPPIDPSLCIVDISVYKTKLGISEEDFKDVLPDYPHDESGSENSPKAPSKPWRFRDIDHLGEKNIRMVYYLWQLVGGNVEQELKKQKLIHSRPSILTLPSVMANEGEVFGGEFQRQELLPTSTILLPLENLRKRLAPIPVHKYYLLITQGECGTDDLETSQLPLVIREKDVEYQFHRVLLFERLLKAYPYKLDAIIREARKDIPPFYRALVWAALLRVDGAVRERYEAIDKETPTSTDRQIEVDIPRCHQYDELLSSPQGHAKFTRILKAWVVSHPHLVYWQGLDSLCAPFLYLNFENEALAFSCLSAFITKYLHHFFLRDNSAVIQEYLAKFSHLIAFHDPQLFNHLHTIGFIPELYAIPWFLTMFTHVFPLHKIFLLWDTLLLGGSSLPLCVGVALLKQLKDRLLQFGFNECILLFSDMPDINMEQCVHDAVEVFCSSPASLTFRQFDSSTSQKNSENANSPFVDKELLMDAVPLSCLKEEFCGRISGAELLELMAQRSYRGGKSKILLLDVRPTEEFVKGSLPGSLSIPSEAWVSPDGEIPATLLEDVISFKGKILVVIGSVHNQPEVVKVAHALLFNGFPRVCSLHKGIEVFRTSGHLVVPSG